jgi:hypothetical protein
MKLSDMMLDMLIEHEKKAGPSAPIKAFNVRDYIEMDTTSLAIDNIDVNVEIKGDSTNSVISLCDFDLRYVPSDEGNDNFLNGVDFNFDGFSLNNKQKHSFFTIESGVFDSRRHSLQIKNISGGDFKNPDQGEENKEGWSYASNEILAKNVYIKNTFPTRIDMDKLHISGSKLEVVSKKEKSKNISLTLDVETFNQFGKLMTKLSVDTTVINQIEAHYKRFDDSTFHAFVADSIGITLHSINIDSASLQDKNIGVIRQMMIDFKGRTHISKDSLYKISSGILSYNFQDDIITINSFRLTPMFEEEEFFKRARYQTDRMEVFGQQFRFHDFRLEELLKNNLIHFGWIDSDSLYMEIARDKRYPLKGDYKPMPQQMLALLGQKVLIDSVSVRNSYVKYSEYDEKSLLPGTVFVDQFNLKIHNITNLHPLPEGKSTMTVDLSTYIMGLSRLDLSMGISYISADSNFWFNAKSERLDLTSLNPLSENLLGITVRRGAGKVEECFVTANAVQSQGTMLFTYKKLELGLYSRAKDHENKGLFGGITRFLMNDIIIQSNNPRFARKPKTGQVYFRRDPQKSFVNYTWKSLLSGIMSTAGFNNKEQRQEKKDAKRQD